MGRLTAQFKIMLGPVLSSLRPALIRLGFVLLGLIIGLVWAYQFAPVKFYDAEPVHLAEGYKEQWIKMTAVEYEQTGDAEEAARKLVAAGVTPDMVQELITANQAAEPALANQLQALLTIAEANQDAAQEQADKIETGLLSGLLGPLACVLGTALIGLIIAVIMTFYWSIPSGGMTSRGTAARPGSAMASGGPASTGQTGSVPGMSGAVHAERVAAHKAVAAQKTDFAASGEAPPVSQYMSTYVLGDDLYDESFSIETASGEFLGECGSGISETIGVGDPKKVTATEVWLFDKNDIRTVTTVLMSEHAYNDQALRTKLASKGEAVLLKPNSVTTLETQTLRLQVRVIDLQYGEGALPPHSFIERLTVELAAWRKDGGAAIDPGSAPGPDDSAAFGDTSELLNL